MKLGRNADKVVREIGREFFGEPETPEKQGRKIRCQNSPSKFAEKFAGNS